MNAILTPHRTVDACGGRSVSHALIVKANEQFWEQMLEMHLQASPSACGFQTATGDVRGSVWLSGAWNGEVEVRMTRGLAATATAAMLMQATDAVTDADMLDAAREIANMIAGVLKVSLPKPCAMSLPRAEILLEVEQNRLPDARETAVAFDHGAGAMRVSVMEETAPSRAGLPVGTRAVLP